MSSVKPYVGIAHPTASSERVRIIRATPAAIFALLSEPQNLTTILPRVQRVEILERHASSARVRTHMAFGVLGAITAIGEVQWIEGRELLFHADRPVGVESRWTLLPDPAGTRMIATMVLDLAPMMGPLAAFIPAESVAAMIGPDLDAALSAIARRVEMT
ncbi:MAG: SRPBCC family protein [Roseiflexaceae bacterium]|nr:SRPBCC family protein [Roseiflexaceae bacterium]